MSAWEPPDGMAHFVGVVQRASPEDAAELLRLAFENAGEYALVRDLITRRAAPHLLAACRQALRALERADTINPQLFAEAIAEAERA